MQIDHDMDNFQKRLDSISKRHQAETDLNLEGLRASYSKEVLPAMPDDVARRLRDRDSALAVSRQRAAVSLPVDQIQALLVMTDSTHLRELDTAFINSFRLTEYYSPEGLSYPTVYCETLEEFFETYYVDANSSPERRQEMIAGKVAQAEELARTSNGGSGVFGVNIPGLGCYLNGWLFGYHLPDPKTAFQDRERLLYIQATAIHEKLGHGFLTAYSAMGKEKTRLGLSRIEIARKFGLRPAEDPMTAIRAQQDSLLFSVSQLLEEGWSRWVENYLVRTHLNETPRLEHSLEHVLIAVEKLPEQLTEKKELLKNALGILFWQEQAESVDELMTAVRILEVTGSDLDPYFSPILHQPLRYAVGELLFQLAEHRLGALCVPYVALMAANVEFSLDKIGLADLELLVSRDWRYWPDVRLAVLCGLDANGECDVQELAKVVESKLDLSVPTELKA